ncbi:MAG: hypothetical protein IPO98_06795 [Saprospiraceae bacterium]|nr:hypothetical protein [Saprospiraceae bacterium]
MTKVIVDTGHNRNNIFFARLSYVLNFIEKHPSAPDDVRFSLNDPKKEGITISYSDTLSDFQVIPQSRFFINDDINVPSIKCLGVNYLGFSLKGFSNRDGADFIPFDIFETIFFHISRYEEWACSESQLDVHNTMKSSEQYLVKNGLHDVPLVDLLVHYFYSKIGLQPKNIQTSYTITHDIDVMSKYPSFYKFIRGYGNIILYQKHKLKNLALHTYHYMLFILGICPDPYDTFDWLLIKDHPPIQDKVIYWLSGGTTKFEGFFNITDKKVKQIMQLAKSHGYEIGLHPSYDSFENDTTLINEKRILESISGHKIIHSRQHFLRYSIRITGKILEKANLETDSSLGFRDRIGFRCGTGFPYHLYDFEREKPFKFLELPLVVMDMAAMHECGWNSLKWTEHINQFIQANQKYTAISLNFHNSFFDPVLTDAKMLKDWYIQSFVSLGRDSLDVSK